MTAALRRHWPEYLMEAWGLGTIMANAMRVGDHLKAARVSRALAVLAALALTGTQTGTSCR